MGEELKEQIFSLRPDALSALAQSLSIVPMRTKKPAEPADQLSPSDTSFSPSDMSEEDLNLLLEQMNPNDGGSRPESSDSDLKTPDDAEIDALLTVLLDRDSPPQDDEAFDIDWTKLESALDELERSSATARNGAWSRFVTTVIDAWPDKCQPSPPDFARLGYIFIAGAAIAGVRPRDIGCG